MQPFDELIEYIGFGSADIERLRELGPLLKPHMASVVDTFHEAVEANGQTRSILEGQEHLDGLRRSLTHWLSSLFVGPYDAQYFEGRRRIGRMHVAVGMQPHFLFGAMNVMRSQLTALVLAEELDDTAATLSSVNKILDIELTVMLQTYWDDVMESKLQMPAALAAGVAHEIRNPLNAIGLQLTLLDRKLRAVDGVGQSVNNVIETVRRELGRLGGLTNEIIDFSKPIELRKSWVEPTELIAKIEEIHGPSMAMMGVSFDTTLVGQGGVHCDAGRLHQVLVNLLTNAIDALDGRDDGRIDLAFETRPRSTIIQVRDNGQGMGTTSRVFDIFYTTKASGTGMGLAVVRKIIEAHGGMVRVKSRPNRGTTFTLYLPRPDREKVP